ncbi:MAG: hypothetical protein NW202_13530 [Nitrospira sp.]|nr:hypothetical protein [Nitrospira sp.]
MYAEQVFLTITPSMANNGITPILNTTQIYGTPSSTEIGPQRNQYQNWWLVIPYLYFTGQDVTLTIQQLINGAWASATALAVPTGYTGGANVIAASATPYERFTMRIYAETNIFLTNGAAGPTIADIGRPYLTNVDPENTP